jgi:hypothetical protein
MTMKGIYFCPAPPAGCGSFESRRLEDVPRGTVRKRKAAKAGTIWDTPSNHLRIAVARRPEGRTLMGFRVVVDRSLPMGRLELRDARFGTVVATRNA